jgi:hypothetical protein
VKISLTSTLLRCCSRATRSGPFSANKELLFRINVCINKNTFTSEVLFSKKTLLSKPFFPFFLVFQCLYNFTIQKPVSLQRVIQNQPRHATVEKENRIKDVL